MSMNDVMCCCLNAKRASSQAFGRKAEALPSMDYEEVVWAGKASILLSPANHCQLGSSDRAWEHLGGRHR